MSRRKNKKKKEKQKSLIDMTDVHPKTKAALEKLEKTKKELEKPSKSKCWDSKLEISEGDKCPHVSGRNKPKIFIPYEVWHRIIGLTKELDTEWLGYLGGSHLQDGNWRVTDLRVPKQEVTGTTCKSIDSLESEGVVHSHVNMSTFFSGTDDDYLNENHDFSIVVNKSANKKAVIRVQLPCGSFSIIDADVEIDYPGLPDLDEFIEEAKKNIEEESTTVQSYNDNAWDNWHNQQQGNWWKDNKKNLKNWHKRRQENLKKEKEEKDKKNKSWDIDDLNSIPGATPDSLGVPDYTPEPKKQIYEGFDYGNHFDESDHDD